METIERSALELFAAHGYANVTIEQIAAASGMSVRTFFRYFSSKRDLLLGPPRRMDKALQEAFLAQPEDVPILDAVRDAAVRTAEILAEDFAVDVRWGQAAIASPEILHEVAADQVRAMIDTLTGMVSARLGVDPEKDPRPGVWAAVSASVLQESFHRWVRTGGDTLLADAIRESFRCLPEFLQRD